MTDTHNTVNEEMLLAACKHYIRITDGNDKQLVSEIFELAGQYCENMREEMIERYSKTDLTNQDEHKHQAQN